MNKLCKLWKHVRDVKSPHLTRCFHWLSIYGDTVPQTVHFSMENVEGWTIPAGDNLVDHGSDFLSANDLNSVALDDIDGKSSNCVIWCIMSVSAVIPNTLYSAILLVFDKTWFMYTIFIDQVYVFPWCNCIYILFSIIALTQGLRWRGMEGVNCALLNLYWQLIDKDYCNRYCIKRLLLFAMHCAF